MTKRRAITTKMAVYCLLWRFSGQCDAHLHCPECHDLILAGQRIEFDHIHAVVAGGPHDYENLRPLHYDCHKKKSRRDVQLNCKVKRIAKGGRKRKGPKIKSRGFSKNMSRKFDGTVTARKP